MPLEQNQMTRLNSLLKQILTDTGFLLYFLLQVSSDSLFPLTSMDTVYTVILTYMDFNWASPITVSPQFLPLTSPSFTELLKYIYKTQSKSCLVTFTKPLNIKLQDIPPYSTFPYVTTMSEAPIMVHFTISSMLLTLFQLRDLPKLSWVKFSSPIICQSMSNQLLPYIKMSAPISNLFQVPGRIIHSLL